METEPTPPVGLPIISEEAKNSLLYDLNLDVDPVSQRIVSGISGEQPDSSSVRASALVTDIFSDILVTNPDFVNGTLTTLKGVQDFYDFKIDGFTIGMAVVIAVFDKMSDQSLTERFSRLTSEDVTGALTEIRNGATLSDGVSVLEQVVKIPRIPEQQINLHAVINKLSKRAKPQHNSYIRVGAAAMYRILSKNWHKLAGNNNFSHTPQE